MSFWKRSNSEEYKKDFRVLLEHWISLDRGNQELPDFSEIAGSDSKHIAVKTSVEHLLDFYDEACTAVIFGAADEEALRFYLGPIMEKHAQKLGGFIQVWRKKHDRAERWDCYSATITRWRNDPKDWEGLLQT